MSLLPSIKLHINYYSRLYTVRKEYLVGLTDEVVVLAGLEL